MSPLGIGFEHFLKCVFVIGETACAGRVVVAQVKFVRAVDAETVGDVGSFHSGSVHCGDALYNRLLTRRATHAAGRSP